MRISQKKVQIIDFSRLTCKVNSENNEMSALDNSKISNNLICPYNFSCDRLTCECCDFKACDCSYKCPSTCFCYYDYQQTKHVINCGNRTLSKVPSYLPTIVTNLNLSHNQIKRLNSYEFFDKIQLIQMDLSFNQIKFIEENTFHGLVKLKKLSLSNNQLKIMLGYEFDELISLEELNLNNNMLQFIDEKLFKTLKNLKVVNFEGNSVKHLIDFKIPLSENLNFIKFPTTEVIHSSIFEKNTESKTDSNDAEALINPTESSTQQNCISNKNIVDVSHLNSKYLLINRNNLIIYVAVSILLMFMLVFLIVIVLILKFNLNRKLIRRFLAKFNRIWVFRDYEKCKTNLSTHLSEISSDEIENNFIPKNTNNLSNQTSSQIYHQTLNYDVFLVYNKSDLEIVHNRVVSILRGKPYYYAIAMQHNLKDSTRINSLIDSCTNVVFILSKNLLTQQEYEIAIKTPKCKKVAIIIDDLNDKIVRKIVQPRKVLRWKFCDYNNLKSFHDKITDI